MDEETLAGGGRTWTNDESESSLEK